MNISSNWLGAIHAEFNSPSIELWTTNSFASFLVLIVRQSVLLLALVYCIWVYIEMFRFWVAEIVAIIIYINPYEEKNWEWESNFATKNNKWKKNRSDSFECEKYWLQWIENGRVATKNATRVYYMYENKIAVKTKCRLANNCVITAFVACISNKARVSRSIQR